MDKNACRERLRFITILHRLIPADKHQVAEVQKYVRQAYRNFSTKWGCWYQGAFEYELVDLMKVSNFVADVGSQSRKKNVLLRLGCVLSTQKMSSILTAHHMFVDIKDG